MNFLRVACEARMLMQVKGKIGTALLFILVFAVSRLPGMLSQEFANFSAAYALAFCAGVYLPKKAAWYLPMGAMLVTDLGLNLYYSSRGLNVWSFSVLRYQLFNYMGYAGLIWLGRRFDSKSSFAGLLGGGLLGALLFYLITNTASWLFNPFHNPEYTPSLLGWLTALITGTKGWPQTWHFFWNTMLSGGLFTALFVGTMKATAESPLDKEAGARAEAPAEKDAPEEASA
jgi:hypothetical protein